MESFEVYKLLVTEDNEHGVALADEIRWSYSKKELYLWISYTWLNEFIASIKEIFGDGMFEEGGFKGDFQESGVCFDLKDIMSGYGIDFEEIFPQKKYSE